MKFKKLSILIALCTVGLCLTIPNQAHASVYKTVKTTYTKSGERTPLLYHATNTSKSISVWNLNHTKVRYNLKNHPATTYTVNAITTFSHNGKKAVYYHVIPLSPEKDTKLPGGYVWHNYLAKGHNPNYQLINNESIFYFDTSKEYQAYIKKSPSQALTRKVLALFPNSTVSLDLSRAALKVNQNTFNITNIQSINRISTLDVYLNTANSTSTSQRYAKIKSLLLANGYTTSKRNQKLVIGTDLDNFTFHSWADGMMEQGFITGIEK
ncbi:hypothetical protein [Secundilactobacillus collinoides]|uniref:D-alanyl-D-alanine carboxypeptidase n=1 Tax=Secundilactobacillus collinoides DSM 20515 = JCM 1123 TaxID=1423733 RepID=A0A0R2BI39_SECCO|nr:hypothetical protein [Secundilactobacillus collinoides]KRM75899.1 hypothetical protein FC82_GL002053 [Secundilactobacillus collinoides DSM 20515 = JCM 1123]